MTARELRDAIIALCKDNGYRLCGADGAIIIETHKDARDSDVIFDGEFDR